MTQSLHPSQPTGNRSLERFDLWIALAAIILPVSMTWLYLYSSDPALTGILYPISRLIEFGFPAVWVWLILKHPFKLMKPSLDGMWLGIAFGLIITLLMMILYFGFLKNAPALAETPAAVHTTLLRFNVASLPAFAAFAAFITVFNSSIEEYFWRWFVFGRLKAAKGFTFALIAATLGFGFHHVLILNTFFEPQYFWSATMVFCGLISTGGAIWCWMTHKTGSVFAGWISHMIIDAGAMLIGVDMLIPYWKELAV